MLASVFFCFWTRDSYERLRPVILLQSFLSNTSHSASVTSSDHLLACLHDFAIVDYLQPFVASFIFQNAALYSKQLRFHLLFFWLTIAQRISAFSVITLLLILFLTRFPIEHYRKAGFSYAINLLRLLHSQMVWTSGNETTTSYAGILNISMPPRKKVCWV